MPVTNRLYLLAFFSFGATISKHWACPRCPVCYSTQVYIPRAIYIPRVPVRALVHVDAAKLYPGGVVHIRH